MIEDQEYILKQILSLVDEQKPEGILIAGDIYDKSIPTEEAVALFDRFLTQLHSKQLDIFIISGNHDSSERINYGGKILGASGIHIVGTFQGELEKITMKDEYGEVKVYLLPFVKPALVNRYFPGVTTYQEAVAEVIGHCEVDSQIRNVLVAHQFITSGETLPERCDSEQISVGGLDNVDTVVFEAFDYVALGHLHGAQRIGRDTIRYSGSPLKYSFSEAKQVKSITMIELKEKGMIEITKLPLIPIRDMRQIKGPIAALTDSKFFSQANTQDYIHAILTDEEELYDAIGKLRSIYPNIMRLDFENSKSVYQENLKLAAEAVEQKSPFQLFEEFFISQNNNPLSEQQREVMKKLLDDSEGSV